MDLISTNVNDESLKRNLLIYGSCIPCRFLDIFKEFSEKKTALSVCAEETHFNFTKSKMTTILKLHNPEEISVLTIDGSPHCIQLHFAVEDAKRETGVGTRIRHFAIEKGEVHEASPEKIKEKRHVHM